MTKKERNELCFSSFFMGEGMIRISLDRRKTGNRKSKHYGKETCPWYRQVARLTLRSDDSKVIDWILKEIGGHCFFRAKRDKIWNRRAGTYSFSNPVIIWQAEDLETCKKVARLLLENPMPCKKKIEAKYFLEYIEFKQARYRRGKSYPAGTLEKFEFYHQKMKKLKRFNGQ